MQDHKTHVLIQAHDLSFAQGDVFFVRRASLPETAVPAKTSVIAHSETGHHHAARNAQVYTDSANPEIGYLVFQDLLARPRTGSGSELDKLLAMPRIEHERATNPHRTLALEGAGVIEFRRQREYTPEGYAIRVMD